MPGLSYYRPDRRTALACELWVARSVHNGMSSLVSDLRHSLRVLTANPGFTSVAVAALALGMGANTAIFSVVNAVLLAPLPYTNSDRIMRIERGFKGSDGGGATSIPKFMAWKK